MSLDDSAQERAHQRARIDQLLAEQRKLNDRQRKLHYQDRNFGKKLFVTYLILISLSSAADRDLAVSQRQTTTLRRSIVALENTPLEMLI